MKIVCLLAMRSTKVQSTRAEQIELERYVLGDTLIVDANDELLTFLLEKQSMPFAVVEDAL